ncbi:Uncharacterized protein BP5553_08922 [Venustampulla echinocandica]|uniref:Cyclin-dependent kinase n=1 Tax=Venustampulla echinocandica TaxID=2656787 RepID=A0A370TDD9_9HELO|nr:Uncharacterized protein BP5553_08922 [Venustampulla echinocandica]RDL32466.1 Uncharacterized protein BP5553_08922 [Venustampulla echinocandica]
MSTSPWKNNEQPEVVVDKVLRRAEMGKIGRKLKTRLALAQYKATRGWEDLTLDTIEPRVEEELRRRRPTSSGDALSDSSSSTASELRYPNTRQLMSSPLKGAIFSDQVGPRSGSGSSTGHRKRNYHHHNFDLPSSTSSSRKKLRSSPVASRSHSSRQGSWETQRQLTQSSPIKSRKATHFTTSAGPNVSFYRGSSHMPHDIPSTNFAAESDEEDNCLPTYSFNIRSSPPSTPPPARGRGGSRRAKDKNGKSEEGADLLLYLATSPSPANPSSRGARMHPPSTPPPKSSPLPSSMMTTPGGGSGFLSVFGGPNTPSQAFDFSDFVNITPSPAQKAWPKTPRTLKTPLAVARRRLTFDNLQPPHSSPGLRDQVTSSAKHTGLGMQLGGDLMS